MELSVRARPAHEPMHEARARSRSENITAHPFARTSQHTHSRKRVACFDLVGFEDSPRPLSERDGRSGVRERRGPLHLPTVPSWPSELVPLSPRLRKLAPLLLWRRRPRVSAQHRGQLADRMREQPLDDAHRA
eukprot:918819-Prymnesium_polylepis.1